MLKRVAALLRAYISVVAIRCGFAEAGLHFAGWRAPVEGQKIAVVAGFSAFHQHLPVSAGGERRGLTSALLTCFHSVAYISVITEEGSAQAYSAGAGVFLCTGVFIGARSVIRCVHASARAAAIVCTGIAVVAFHEDSCADPILTGVV